MGRHRGRAGRREKKACLSRFLQWVCRGKGEEVWLGVKSRVLEVKRLMTLRSRVSHGRRCLRWRDVWGHWG